MVVARKKNIVIRVTDEERRMLGELADLTGLSVSDYVRQHVRSAYHNFKSNIATPKLAKR